MTHQEDMLEDSSALTTSSKYNEYLSSTSLIRLSIPALICQQIAVEWVKSQTDARMCNDIDMKSKSSNRQEVDKRARFVHALKLSEICNSKHVHEHMSLIIHETRSDVCQNICLKGT